MKSIFFKISLIALGCVLASCASIERRIAQNPDYFGGLAPADQEKIRQGQIDIGFTKAMVRMAQGSPSAIRQRTTATENHEIWIYSGVRAEFVYPDCSPFYYGGGISYTRYGAGYGIHHGPHRLLHLHDPVTQYRQYETARVIFEGDTVKAIEQVTSGK